MANINLQQMPLIMATAAIVCIAGTLKTSAAAAQLRGPASGGGGNNYNTALYDNRWLPLSEEQATSVLHKPLALHRYGIGGGGQEAEERRSYRSNSSGGGGGGGGFEAMLNGLSNLSGLGHISNGYASVAPTHTEALALASSSSKQEIPIYEEQHDDAAVAAVAATANDYGDGGNGDGGIDAGDHIQQHHQQQQHQQHSSAGLHPTIYDYPAVATGGGGGGYLPAFGGAEHNALTPSEAQQYKEAVVAAAQQHQHQHQQQVEQSQGHHYAYDKISVGNYLNHYDQNSDGFESYRQHHADEQQYQQQQQHQQQQQLEHASYSSSAGGSASGGSDYEDHVDSDGGAGDHGANFLAESSGHDGAQAHSHQSHHHVDIINYVPVKHVKKEHVPVEKPVKIPVSHAVIIPVKKPVPIHIPITKQVQVPIEKELKVPVERIIPVPVEKHIPVPVAKHVPYHVVKYVPIKVPKPFPVKVPVFKTVLHKVKSWW
ncbi:transcription factor MafA isoform X2 [Drosophila nasuta]|uniref:transcription factor MafA isoform X2 n=1 Tax=Drosophila nasuta TaxID=42062 RepID=UPI00295E3A02|nr:transcription factor MafA isoform X2 [Drosophila nasuta]